MCSYPAESCQVRNGSGDLTSFTLALFECQPSTASSFSAITTGRAMFTAYVIELVP